MNHDIIRELQDQSEKDNKCIALAMEFITKLEKEIKDRDKVIAALVITGKDDPNV